MKEAKSTKKNFAEKNYGNEEAEKTAYKFACVPDMGKMDGSFGQDCYERDDDDAFFKSFLGRGRDKKCFFAEERIIFSITLCFHATLARKKSH